MRKHLKKMHYDTECERVEHLVQLFNDNDLLSVDIVIKRVKNIEVFAWELKYIYLVDDALVKYVSSKVTKHPVKLIDSPFVELHLVASNNQYFTIKKEQIYKLYINDKPLDLFLLSGQQFIKSLYLESSKPSDNLKSCYDDEESYKIQYGTNIEYFEIFFYNDQKLRFDIKWFSGANTNYQFLQRSKIDNNVYYYSFDLSKITNNYFNNYALEEYFKYFLKLPYEHKLTEKDVLNVKYLYLPFYDNNSFVRYQHLEKDILKLTKLETLVLNFDCKNVRTVDLSNLTKLINLKNLEIINKNAKLTGLEILKRSSFNITIK